MPKPFMSFYWRLALVAALLFSTVLSCADTKVEEQNSQPKADAPTGGALPTSRPATSTKPASGGDKPVDGKQSPTWLVMLYQDADDKILEKDIFTDLNEAERVGSTDNVKIVSQIDRFKGGFKGDGDWTTAKRFLLEQDDNLDHIASQELADLGEVNMADGNTLADFVIWAATTYPSDKYVLVLSDHGAGWPGGWTDPAPENNPKNSLIEGFDDMIYLTELDKALARVQSEAGIDQFEIIGFDACLMAHLEVLSAVAPYAHYAVLSQEVEPSMGWAYSSFLKDLVKNQNIDSADLAKSIVKSYIDEDTLIVDDIARQRYLRDNYETSNDPGAAELAREEGKSVTLTAVDLQKLPGVLTAVDALAESMSGINQKMVARARTATQSFENVFGEDFPPPYIDLGHFAKLIKRESTSEKVGKAADAVRAAISDAVIAEKHGMEKKGATGISIYFPNSKLFKMQGADYATYQKISDRFTGENLWDNFLAFHYTGQKLVNDNKPVQNSQVVGPGAGKVTITPIKLSGKTASTGKPVTLSTVVTGQQVSYIYIFTGRYDDKTGAIQIVDMDYIDPEKTREMDGIVLPDWGPDPKIEIEFDWEPIAFALYDGTNLEPALLNPETFGVDMKNTIYSVDGIYQFADGGDPFFARVYLSGEGPVSRILGFSGMEDKGPQREVTPKDGDTLTILDQWIEASKGDEVNYTYHEAGKMTLGKELLSWEQVESPAGNYVVGFIVEDMDGNLYEEYADIKVK